LIRGDSLNYNLPIHVPDQGTPRQIGRNAGDRVFRSAARHSRVVRFLRFSIPAAILAIAGIILVATFSPLNKVKNSVFDPGDISVSGTKLIMKSPRYTGFTKDGRPYEMVADRAAHDYTRPDIVELKDIDAKVELQDGQHVTITSINGVYDTKGEVLKLNNHIILNTTSGYEGRLSEATVYVSSSRVVSESPVELKLPNGLLHANRLEVTENGTVFVFGGGVEMDLDPQKMQPRAATQDSATAGAPAQTAPVQTAPMQQATVRRSTSSP
jgi:lipopolysaccharide export system protein LptC